MGIVGRSIDVTCGGVPGRRVPEIPCLQTACGCSPRVCDAPHLDINKGFLHNASTQCGAGTYLQGCTVPIFHEFVISLAILSTLYSVEMSWIRSVECVCDVRSHDFVIFFERRYDDWKPIRDNVVYPGNALCRLRYDATSRFGTASSDRDTAGHLLRGNHSQFSANCPWVGDHQRNDN